ncbi:cofilin/actin-depolymerizing factor homolog [Scaptodrosophila lebanonensis]|uniref:Cofilin/actin-depolymerizing factor homolog n=1 Tax=Drosophila lebanonensis TaxID=7225 RepID=A0A6J2UKQ8_DROLE|nr:cofilin/actin-depolymerizing factor homolog [Scaptodrosophila lebanonensis]
MYNSQGLRMNVNCSENTFSFYEAIRKNKKYRYITFCIDANGTIDIETIGPRDTDYQQFMEDLMRGGPGECRYGLFDLEYMHHCSITDTDCKREKLIMLCWCPNGAKAKLKVQYQSYLRSFVECLTGLQYYRTVSELSEMTRDAVEQYLRATDK